MFCKQNFKMLSFTFCLAKHAPLPLGEAAGQVSLAGGEGKNVASKYNPSYHPLSDFAKAKPSLPKGEKNVLQTEL